MYKNFKKKSHIAQSEILRSMGYTKNNYIYVLIEINTDQNRR